MAAVTRILGDGRGLPHAGESECPYAWPMDDHRATGPTQPLAPTGGSAPTVTSSTGTEVDAHISATAATRAELVFSLAVAHGPAVTEEQLVLRVDGVEVPLAEVPAPDGGRLHLARVPAGSLTLDSRALASPSPWPAPAAYPWRTPRPESFSDPGLRTGAHAHVVQWGP